MEWQKMVLCRYDWHNPLSDEYKHISDISFSTIMTKWASFLYTCDSNWEYMKHGPVNVTKTGHKSYNSWFISSLFTYIKPDWWFNIYGTKSKTSINDILYTRETELVQWLGWMTQWYTPSGLHKRPNPECLVTASSYAWYCDSFSFLIMIHSAS